ncbi:hypothetical protein Tco_0993279 [Tanacetum coccineum]|uniref:Uncharacterized protein n=1 Tax=Tanacetum coccineum TaxID=301880 RepID=A0ABQ5F4P5_9ASTR
MLGKRPNKVYDPFLKAGLGYQNPERLKKAIAAQPKMYDGERLHNTKLIIDSPDSEETLEDAQEHSRVKRSLFTSLVAAKSRNLGTTSVVVKSRTLSNYMKNKIATSKKWQKWVKHQQSFNWSPKSKTAQSTPSVSKSSTSVRKKSKTSVTTQKWVAKLSTLPSAFVLCDEGDPTRPLDC